MVSAGELGFTLAHEHLIILSPGMRENWPTLYDEAAIAGQIRAKLEAARAAGVRTIIDATTVDLGRSIPLAAAGAEGTGVNVICATGFWLHPPRALALLSTDRIADLLTSDVETGIQGTGVRAGVIKVATSGRVPRGLARRMLQAAAAGQRRTAVPITTHADAGRRGGLAQLDVLEASGADLARVLVGHAGDSLDLGYVDALLGRGVLVGIDRFRPATQGMALPTVEDLVAFVAALCSAGHGSRLVLSHDATAFNDTTSQLRDFSFVPRVVLPALMKVGVSETDIRAMTIDNIRRLFDRQG